MGRGIMRGRGAPRGNRPMQTPNFVQNYRAVAPPPQSQGLQDIDMELELLKRKREIIEKQQQMLSSNIRQINTFDESSYYDNSYDSYGESNYGGGGGSTARKRPIPVWEHESGSPPKRFSGPASRGARKPFESRSGPAPHNLRSDFQPARPFRRPDPPPSNRRDFKPTKVTKPYAPAPLMNFSNYEAVQRRKLVDKAAGLVSAKKPKAPPAASDDWVLRSDVEPNRKIIGRLELVLGTILKEMKTAHPEYEDLFVAPGPTRAMKQVLRDRIRLAMIGKSAFSVDYVKSVYFETYPASEENDIIMKGLESLQAGERFVPIESGDAKTYFKKNMSRLMRLKLEQLINKMEDVVNVKGHQYGRPTPKKSKYANFKIAKMNARAKLAEQAGEKSGEKIEKDSEKTGEGQSKDADISESQHQDEDVQIVEAKENLPIDVDKHDESKTPEKKQGTKTGEPKTYDNEPAVYEDDIFSTAEYMAFDKFMNIKMLQLLKKYIPKISSLVEWDQAYNKLEAAVKQETRVKLGGDPVGPERRPYAPLPYNVKLMGKPSLPKRKVMERFFDDFKPSHIKRHKAVHNLLFVGFDSKESYDKILEANGTVIGRNTLDIMSYENKFLKNQAPTRNTEPPVQEVKDKSEQLITPDIDEQITSLLHTIRESQDCDTSTEIIDDTEENVAEGPETVEINDDENKLQESAENENNGVIEINDGDATEVQDLTEDNDDATHADGDVTEITEENGTGITEEKTTETNDDTGKENEQTDLVQEIADTETLKEDTQTNVTGDNIPEVADANKTAVDALKEKPEVKMTPTRASARLANPPTIRTRRTSTMK